MTTINTNYTPYQQSLASYLGGSNTAQSNSNDSKPSLLAALVGGSDNSNSNDLLSFFENQSGIRPYNFPTDSNGKTVIPTVDEMNNASTPDTQLSLANYVAQSVLMQSDASTKTGNAARVSDITSQAQSVLQALASSTINLTQDGASALSATQQQTTSQTLNAINTALSQVVNLLPKTDDATRTALTSKISDLDTLAYNIAGLTGTAWTSVTGNSGNTISGYSAATQNTASGSTSASGLLNITV